MNATLVSTETAPADRIATDSTPPDLTYLAGFSSEDLACNRVGRLSPNQRLELRHAVRVELVVIAAILAFVVLGFTVSQDHGAAVVACIVLVIAVVHLLQGVTELRQGVVSEIVGNAWPEFVPDSEGPDDYWLHIGDLKLDITQTAYSTFRAGGPYRIYYLAITNTAIGGEVLPDWKSAPQPKTGRPWWSHFSIGIE